jgi:hypothetical protein
MEVCIHGRLAVGSAPLTKGARWTDAQALEQAKGLFGRKCEVFYSASVAPQ